MTEIERIAAGLTKAEIECLLGAEIKGPLKGVTVGGKPFMPDYHSVEVPGKDRMAVYDLQKLGVWSLPIRSGGRFCSGIYHGEIKPLGLALRAHLEKRNAE